MTATLARPKRRIEPAAELPTKWPWLFRLFQKYSRKYAAKHLHAVRVARHGDVPKLSAEPVIFVVNHPSWWDPIIGFILSSHWPNRLDYGPIDAAALKNYKFLSKVGLFGVETGTPRGAFQFLRTAKALLANDNATLWITAQGEFTDSRQRPVKLRSGVGHLATEIDRGQIIPIAIEYTFWNERTPEALVAFGEPIELGEHRDRTAKHWTAVVEQGLENTMDRLAIDGMSRDPNRFRTLVSGQVGVHGVYDLGRRLKSWIRGESFHAGHDRPEVGRH